MLEALLLIVFQVRIHSLADCFLGNPQPLARSVSEQADDMIIGERRLDLRHCVYERISPVGL